MKKFLILFVVLFFTIHSSDNLVPGITNNTSDTINIEGKIAFIRKLNIPPNMNDHRETIVFLRRIQGFRLKLRPNVYASLLIDKNKLSLQNKSQIQTDEKQYRVHPNPKFIQSSLLFDKHLNNSETLTSETYFVLLLNNVKKENKYETDHVYSGKHVFKNENPTITDQDFEAPRDRFRLPREHERE